MSTVTFHAQRRSPIGGGDARHELITCRPATITADTPDAVTVRAPNGEERTFARDLWDINIIGDDGPLVPDVRLRATVEVVVPADLVAAAAADLGTDDPVGAAHHAYTLPDGSLTLEGADIVAKTLRDGTAHTRADVSATTEKATL